MILMLVTMDSNKSAWDDLTFRLFLGPVQYKNNGQYQSGDIAKIAENFDGSLQYKNNGQYQSGDIKGIASNFDGSLQYKNNGQYKSIIVEAVRWKTSQELIKAVKEQWHKALYGKRLEDRKRYFEDIQEQRKQIRDKLIEQQAKVHEDYGDIGDGIKALDRYGKKVDGALIMWYKDTKSHKERRILRGSVSADASSPKDPYHSTVNTITTDKMYIIDLAPKIIRKSSKNIVLTKVQGRNSTRKELVSGGDVFFTVSGEINSNQDGVYPKYDVQKLINIMQHNGVISVNNILFDQLNVSQILIQDFQLDTPVYQNIQPYSFTCVAVEPDEQSVIDDTIDIINYKLNTSGASGVIDIAAQSRLSQVIDNGVMHSAGWAINSAVDLWASEFSSGLNDIISNI